MSNFLETRKPRELECLRHEPGPHSFGHFCLAFKGQPVARRQARYSKVPARVSHGFAGSIAVNIAESVELSIDNSTG
jgi:hypothetical protein